MKEKLRNAKGITLIALVITIIILLILAMVSINLVLNEGIIKRAENAVNAYNEAQTNELEQLNEIENQLGDTGKLLWYELTEEEKTETVNSGLVEIDDNGDGGYTIAYSQENNCEYIIRIEVINGKTVCLALFKSAEKSSDTSYENHSAIMCFINEKYLNKDYQKINTWYYTPVQSHISEKGIEEFKGDINDWIPQNGIICQSYLDRLIENFKI